MENAGQPPATRPLVWVAFWLMIAFFVASGVNQYLNPQPPTLKELEPLLMTAKKEPGPMSALQAATFERSFLELQKSGPNSRLTDLVAISRFDLGRTLQASDQASLSERPVGIPKGLFLRTYELRKIPLKLSPEDDAALKKAGAWGEIVRADAVIATPVSPAGTATKEQPDVPIVTRAIVIAFILISWAVGRYYINGYRLKAANPGLPLPLPWQPEEAAESESVALRLVLLPILLICTYVLPLPPELSLALSMASVTILCGMPIRGYRIPWGKLLSWGQRNPIAWGLGTYIGAFPVLAVTFIISAGLSLLLPAGSHSTTDALAMDPSTATSAFITAVILAPIFEELLFRGVLMPLFTQVFGRLRYGIIASSLIFATIHMQGPPTWPVLFALGAMCSFAYVHTRSIWASILLHALHNGLILATTFSLTS